MLTWRLGCVGATRGESATTPTLAEILRGVSHWIPDEQPDAVGDLLLGWFAAHPV